MRHLLIALAMFALPFSAHAQSACTLQMSDLTMPLKALSATPAVQLSQRQSSQREPIQRYTLDYSDGSTIILEQQDCTNLNLRITLFTKDPVPNSTYLNRMASVLSITPMWRAYFEGQSAATLLQTELASPAFTSQLTKAQFAYDASPRISSSGHISAASIGFMSGNASTLFASALTLTISVKP